MQAGATAKLGERMECNATLGDLHSPPADRAVRPNRQIGLLPCDVLVREGPSTLGLTELLDALLIRLILRPVPLWPTGHAAWWSPAWLRKVLPKISFSH